MGNIFLSKRQLDNGTYCVHYILGQKIFSTYDDMFSYLLDSYRIEELLESKDFTDTEKEFLKLQII